VPPIYQPDVMARAVLDVARRPRRERWVTWSATKAILGQRVVPGLLDRYLGRIGYRAQQADRPPEPGRPDNLETFVPGDMGARGEFDAQARDSSLALWLTTRRRGIAAGLAAAALGLVGWRALRA
jgi:hypothetical protein